MKSFFSLWAIACLSFILFACDNNKQDDTTKAIPDAPKSKTDAEVKGEIETEGIKQAGSLGKEAIQLRKEHNNNKWKEDSLKTANMPERWVYIIGDQIGSEKEAWRAFDKFKAIPNVYILKKGKSEYYIVKDDQYSRDRLGDSSLSFKKQIASIEPNVQTKNLGLLCPHKQPTVTDPIIYRKDGKHEARCLICD